MDNEENPDDLRLPFMEAASSATRDERTEVSIWADDVEAANFAATAAAAALLFSSSLVLGPGKDTIVWTRGD